MTSYRDSKQYLSEADRGPQVKTQSFLRRLVESVKDQIIEEPIMIFPMSLAVAGSLLIVAAVVAAIVGLVMVLMP